MVRKSKQQEAILRILKGTTSHPPAEWLYEQVKREIPNISLGTIYRNLRLLKRAGMISELDLTGTLSRFDSTVRNHYHFRCEGCGNVFDVDEMVDEIMDDRVARKTGLKVSHHRLEFRGLCQNCQS